MASKISALRLTLSKYKRRYLQSRVVADQRRKVDFAFIHVPKCGGTSITRAIGQRIKLHDTALERRDKLGIDRWNAIYTFSVVRHPYERALSFYFFSRNTMYAQSRVGALSLNDWVRAALRDRLISATVADHQLAPCKAWLADETGSILVEDIHKLETLDDTWPRIMRRTSAQTLPHVNKSHGGERGRDAFDLTSLNILQDHFRDDFDAFGYDP